ACGMSLCSSGLSTYYRPEMISRRSPIAVDTALSKPSAASLKNRPDIALGPTLSISCVGSYQIKQIVNCQISRSDTIRSGNSISLTFDLSLLANSYENKKIHTEYNHHPAPVALDTCSYREADRLHDIQACPT